MHMHSLAVLPLTSKCNQVVFLDADTMVVQVKKKSDIFYSKHVGSRGPIQELTILYSLLFQPIDELFDYPQFSAAVDIGGVLNTGVFVAEPNVATYQDIMNTYENTPSYNRGDQGFLNYYFNQSADILPGNYNLMIKFTVSVSNER